MLPYVITTSTVLVDNQNAGATLQSIQAAQPYAPSLAKPVCSATPQDVIAKLKDPTTTPLARPEMASLVNILQTCNSTHNVLNAIAAAGGLGNPHVAGLNAFNATATDIQNGKPVTQDQIAGVAKDSPALASLLVAAEKLVPAQKTSPGEWKRWWTVCLIGMAIFGVLVFFMRGRWSPRAARRDLAERDRLVSEELARLAIEEPAPV